MNDVTTIVFGTILFFMFAVSIAGFFLVHQRRLLKEKNRVQELEIELQKKTVNAVLEAQEKERKRLAQDMHDELGAMILALKLNNHSLLKPEFAGSQSAAKVEENEHLIDDIAEHVRSVSHNLLPPSLKRGELSDAIGDLCDSLNGNDKVVIGFKKNTSTAELPERHKVSIYRVLNEWITNLIKHSGAQHIDIDIDHIRKHFVLRIVDDGKEFDLKESLRTSKGTGLMSMQGRIHQMGADYSYQRYHFKENRFELYYPLNQTTK